jgi:hypothetical protein
MANFEVRPEADAMSKPLFVKWNSIIEAHKDKNNVEVEFRFGRRSGTKFDTNVGQSTFEKVLGALKKYEGWESTNHTVSTVYYFEGGKRLSVNEATEEQVGQVKTRLKVDDVELQGHSLDVRLGISSEVPWEYDGEETSTEQKTKERWSFVRKNLSIDMSVVKGTPDDKDSDDDTMYQIEMEIIDPSKIQNKIELFNLMYKIFDILKCVRA